MQHHVASANAPAPPWQSCRGPSRTYVLTLCGTVVGLCLGGAAARRTHGPFDPLASLAPSSDIVRTVDEAFVTGDDGWCSVGPGTDLRVADPAHANGNTVDVVVEGVTVGSGRCPAGRTGTLRRWEVDAWRAGRSAIATARIR